MFISKEVKELIKDIKEKYYEWELTNYTFNSKVSNISIWVANGVSFIDFYPKMNAFNIIEKIAIKNAIKYAVIKICLLR